MSYPISSATPLHTFLSHAAMSQLRIKREIARRRPSVIVLSSYDVAFGYFVAPFRMQSLPTVFIYHSAFVSDAADAIKTWPFLLSRLDGPTRRFMQQVEKVIFTSTSHLIAVSPFSRREIEERIGQPASVVVIPTGVDTEFFVPGDRASARSRLGIDPNAKMLLTVGRLVPVKRYDRAINALASLRRNDPSYVLVIAGAGPAETALRKQAASLGDSVRFAGFVDGPALLDLYHAADLVLCTSEFENWSVAILESLATATPVVGTPTGSTPDLLRLVDEQLILADVGAADLANRISQLLARPARMAALGERARLETVARFSWDRTAEAIEGELRRISTQA